MHFSFFLYKHTHYSIPFSLLPKKDWIHDPSFLLFPLIPRYSDLLKSSISHLPHSKVWPYQLCLTMYAICLCISPCISLSIPLRNSLCHFKAYLCFYVPLSIFFHHIFLSFCLPWFVCFCFACFVFVCMVIVPLSFSKEHHGTALMPFWFLNGTSLNSINALLVLNGTSLNSPLNSNNALLVLNGTSIEQHLMPFWFSTGHH